MSDPEITKKRKLEEGQPDVSIEKVCDMISLWDNTQLVSVLSKLGSESTWALQAIKEENNKSVKLRKVFVRNLDFQTTDESLSSCFSQFGTVTEAVVIRNKSDNKSKGFGFVTFEDCEGAERSYQSPTLEIDGRTAYVNLAAKRTATGDNATNSNSTFNKNNAVDMHSNNPLTKLFVRSLAYQTTQEELHQFMSQYGQISEAVILQNKDGTSKGYGFVTFTGVDSANRALEQATKQLSGRDIHVKLAAANDGHVARNQNNNSYGNNNQQQMQQMNFMNRMQMMNAQQQLMSSMMMGNQQQGGASGMGGMGQMGQMGQNQANPYGQQQQSTDFSQLAQQQQLGGGSGMGLGYQQQW